MHVGSVSQLATSNQTNSNSKNISFNSLNTNFFGDIKHGFRRIEFHHRMRFSNWYNYEFKYHPEKYIKRVAYTLAGILALIGSGTALISIDSKQRANNNKVNYDKATRTILLEAARDSLSAQGSIETPDELNDIKDIIKLKNELLKDVPYNSRLRKIMEDFFNNDLIKAYINGEGEGGTEINDYERSLIEFHMTDKLKTLSNEN